MLCKSMKTKILLYTTMFFKKYIYISNEQLSCRYIIIYILLLKSPNHIKLLR